MNLLNNVATAVTTVFGNSCAYSREDMCLAENGIN